MSGADLGLISAPILDDFYYGAEMKHETISQIRLISLGMPDEEFYRMEAKRLRGEYLADQLHRLIDRLKKFFKTSAVKVQRPIVSEHSVRA